MQKQILLQRGNALGNETTAYARLQAGGASPAKLEKAAYSIIDNFVSLKALSAQNPEAVLANVKDAHDKLYGALNEGLYSQEQVFAALRRSVAEIEELLEVVKSVNMGVSRP